MHPKIVFSIFAGHVALAFAGPAVAQSTGANRTFVSGLGIDNSTCIMPSRPCRTFAYALAQTAAGGALVAQNAAEYGPVTITTAMSIIGPDGGGAKITAAAGGDGITLSAGSGDAIALRGLEIVGANSGINLNSFGSLVVADSVIRGGTYGIISFAGGQVTVKGTSITDSGSIGIFLSGANLVMTESRVTHAGDVAVSATGATFTDCTFVNSGTGVSISGTGFLKNSLVASNGTGVAAASNTTIWFDRTTITANGTGISAINNGATLNSFGDNSIAGNGTDVSGTPVTKVTPN